MRSHKAERRHRATRHAESAYIVAVLDYNREFIPRWFQSPATVHFKHLRQFVDERPNMRAAWGRFVRARGWR